MVAKVKGMFVLIVPFVVALALRPTTSMTSENVGQVGRENMIERNQGIEFEKRHGAEGKTKRVINVSVKRLVRSLRTAKRLTLWSWYWVPMCFAYIVLNAISWIGDQAYKGAEWINAHPPKW